MNKSKLIALGIGAGLMAAALFSFKFYRYTSWVDEMVGPYAWKAVCKTTTSIEVFGKFSYFEGPALPNSECREAINAWLTEQPNEGCSVDTTQLTATCREAYKHPLY